MLKIVAAEVGTGGLGPRFAIRGWRFGCRLGLGWIKALGGSMVTESQSVRIASRQSPVPIPNSR
ncbi:MAG: hypothetical protein BGO01_07215 [Armatimonadetes bacterium 55-13]|nr:hypothetical protein [Armatimonadota bacterium]OJU62288.1 MAG: hypothetical protein BGO01_07215 [Armatimonadetes bacterium 55-13]